MLSTFAARSSFGVRGVSFGAHRRLAALMLSLIIFSAAICCAGLPDMQNVARPNPDPGAQAGWDVFIPPITAASALVGTPTIAEWTRTGVSDDTLILTGDALSNNTGNDQGKDTQFLIYGQTATSDGVQGIAAMQRLDGLKAAITLPAGLPAWSTYFLWPKNSTGYGNPIGINKTEAWWIGPYTQASVGDTVSVYGRNLSHNNGTTSSWIYIKPTGAAGQWVTPTSVNPYRVQFTVPSLANGTYEVWVHNGHGGAYGWSGPLSLTIASPYLWNGSTFDVTAYGANPNDMLDDAPAIDQAVYYAQVYRDNNPGSHPTVYFPAGTYYMSYGIGLAHDVRYHGAGKNSTYIKCNSDFAIPGSGKLGLMYGQGGPMGPLEVSDLTLDANGYYGIGDGYTGYLMYLGWSSAVDQHFINLRIQNLVAGTDIMRLGNTTRASFTNCDFIGGHTHLLCGSQIAFQGCNFYGANDALTAIFEYAISNLSVSNCTFQDYDINSSTGQSLGRALTGSTDWGTHQNMYFGDNTSTNLGPRAAASDTNSGEQVMCEGGYTQYQGTATSGTTTTVTFSDLNTDYTGYSAIIIGGKGVGQYRGITAFNAGSKTITVSPAWNVAPDSTSTLIIEKTVTKWVVYHNTLDSKDDYATRYTATCAIEPYGGTFDWIGDNNTITDMRTAIAVPCIQQYARPIDGIQPCYFNYYANNNIDDCYEGFRTVSGIPSGGISYPSGFIGNVFRNNSLTDVATYGADQDCDQSASGFRFDMNLFEHNTFTNVPYGFKADIQGIGASSKSTILYKNSFNLGTATFNGSYGYYFGTSQQAPVLNTNTWTGFQTTYTGSLPGAILETPYRAFNVLGTTGGASQTATMVIRNVGTASLSWTATSDSAWLTLSSGSGTVANENSSSNVTLTCNPGALASGVYTGTVTITGASQTQKVVVTFTVSPNLPSGSMKLWLKADVGVTKDGNNLVSTWADQSGNGNDVTPYWTYNPEYVPAAINGWPALYFDGGCDNLRKMLSASLPGNFSMFAVWSSPFAQVKQNQSGNNNRVFSCPPAGASGYDYISVVNGTGTATAPTIRSDTFCLNPTQSMAVFGMGAMFDATGVCGGDFAISGYIPEAIIYNRTLTTQERADVMTYLSNKYAIPSAGTPPTVSLTTPTDGQVYTTVPATISYAANATATGGSINRVEFYQGSNYVGTDNSAPYNCDWTNVGVGTYVLTAKAFDSNGLSTVSTPITVRVNAAPTVSITAPTGGSSFTAPATINITANPSDTDGTISKVEFYNNGLLLGTDSSSAGGWTYSWTNVEASGTNGINLTAKAYDNDNVSATSSGVLCTTTDNAAKCYWKFDENTGTSAGDSSGTGNTGTITGASWITGKISYGLSFNGTSNYVQNATATGLPAANVNQTECFWYYLSANPSVRKTALCLTGTSSGVYIGFNSSTVFGVWKNGGTALVTTTTLPTAGAWHHVAYVRNGTSNYLYVDGSQKATNTTTPNSAAATVINAGRTASGADYWPGYIDEVRVYNRALSAAEITALAAAKQ